MASQEVTGGTAEDIDALREEFQGSPLQVKHGISFETAYCITPIPRQPEDYDGPQRYCQRRVGKFTPDEWALRWDDDYQEYDERTYKPKCRFHGGSCNGLNGDNLTPGFANLKHGMYAEDWRLKEDFSEADQQMFDWILSWADIYGWPPQEEDPARYDLLEQFAYDRVRTLRAEEWFEGVAEGSDSGTQSEVEFRDVRDDQGVVVGEVPVPNTLSEDLRLLRKELIDIMKELGLTPKSRGQMDLMDSKQSAAEAVGDLAAEALDSETEFDPEQFADEAEAADDEAESHDGT